MKLVEFLTKVVSEQTFRQQFCKDPQGTIRKAELSREAQKAIRSGDPRHVRYVICAAEVPALHKFDPID